MKILNRLTAPVFLILPLLLASGTRADTPLGYLMVGPMGHWNFSGYELKSFSWGIELSGWLYKRDMDADGFFSNSPDDSQPGYGLALGFDMDKRAIRWYAEPEFGWVFVGTSLGPVLEVSRGEGVARLGIQGSAWLAALVGFDFRYRYVNGRHDQAIGTFAKLGGLVLGRGKPTATAD